jgi:hypothetical protein
LTFNIIDVTGTSKGKGFQGAIKRHGQGRGPMAHGSHFHSWKPLPFEVPVTSIMSPASKVSTVTS